MNSAQSELWTRLETFVFDEPGTTLTFARRLARENDWTAEFTQRVIREYKRFVFLAMEAGHPVSPSGEVDQAWHLHLTYTKSYWQDLCGEALGGRRLHHHPTKGGSDEAAKFDGQYQRTLDSYSRLFGEEPPPDIWIPAGERRHAKGGKHRWVDTKRYWLVPKWIIWAGAASAGALAAVVAVSGCSMPMAGLAMTGPVFLGFLVFLLVGGMICASLVRFLMCGPGGKGEPPSDLYEIAYLAGGGVRVLQTALVGLHAAKCVYVYPGKEPFVKRVQVPEQALHDVEVLVWGLLPEDGATVSLGDLQRGLHSAFEKMETGLRKRGLLSPAATTAAWAGFAVLLVAPLVGLIRIITGMANDRPVAGLIVLTLVGLVVAGLAFPLAEIETKPKRKCGA